MPLARLDMALLGTSGLHQHFEDKIVVRPWLTVVSTKLGLRMHPKLQLLWFVFPASRQRIGVCEHTAFTFIPANMVMVLVDIRGFIEDQVQH